MNDIPVRKHRVTTIPNGVRFGTGTAAGETLTGSVVTRLSDRRPVSVFAKPRRLTNIREQTLLATVNWENGAGGDRREPADRHTGGGRGDRDDGRRSGSRWWVREDGLRSARPEPTGPVGGLSRTGGGGR